MITVKTRTKDITVKELQTANRKSENLSTNFFRQLPYSYYQIRNCAFNWSNPHLRISGMIIHPSDEKVKMLNNSYKILTLP
jgi:hypothetical protein